MSPSPVVEIDRELRPDGSTVVTFSLAPGRHVKVTFPAGRATPDNVEASRRSLQDEGLFPRYQFPHKRAG